jgi:myo-inositol-1(or 4)-monophosphatase
MDYHDFALQLARSAGKRLKTAHDGKIFSVSHKGTEPRDVVTNIDREINRFMIDEIRRTFPAHRISSEEEGTTPGSRESDYEWVLDPIDGTANFARGIPHFAVCISLLHKDTPIAAAVYNPTTDELYSFEKDRSAIRNDAPIRVSSIARLAEAQALLTVGHDASLLDWGTAVYREFLGRMKKTRSLGSSSLDLCFLAAGRADIVLYGTLTTRDAAGALGILRATGGEIYTPNGEPAGFSTQPQIAIATANRTLFDELRPLLHIELLPSFANLRGRSA